MPMGSLKLNLWFYASTRPWSIRMRASPTIPLMAQAKCWSISTSFSLRLLGTSSLDDCIFFSTPRITPSFVFTPIAVEPNYIDRVSELAYLQQVKYFFALSLFHFAPVKRLCAKFLTKKWRETRAWLIWMIQAYLDGLDGVLDLIDTTLRREGVHTSVVLFLTTKR